MKAIIEIDIPDYQIGQEVSIYFKDTMMIKGVVQEPKTGHWIQTNEFFINQDGQFIYKFICSECKSVEFKKSKFCPNCGARMESEE